jgi:hypothetical protein
MSEKQKKGPAIKSSGKAAEKKLSKNSSVDFELSDEELGEVSGASGFYICNAKPQQQK